MSGAAGPFPKVTGDATPAPSVPTAESERILLLECRLEKVCSALDEARADADVLRTSLAQAAAREADHARRYSLVHQELADARADIASLHERLSRSEALRAELEGHLFEAGARGDAAELMRLRRELVSQRERHLANDQSAARLRARVDELLLSRETLLTRVAEWQRLVQKDDPDAVDLGEFIAELRREILSLEQRNAASERQGVALRERLVRAGVDPAVIDEDFDGGTVVAPMAPLRVAPPADRITPAVAPRKPIAADSFENSLSSTVGASPAWEQDEASVPALTVDRRRTNPVESDSLAASARDNATVKMVRPAEAASNEPEALPEPATIGPMAELDAADPAVRAAAYERLIRVFEGSPSLLADYLRSGLADPDPRVRRRTVLAAATARRLALRPLLEPLRADSDPQVRRVVREVLRYAQDDPEATIGYDDRNRAAHSTRSHFTE